MAQPRPATPNYLEEVNRARQQSRSGRRQRFDDIVNPMDSAAAMDRLQGVEVSDFSSGGADSPPINLAAALSSGGAGTATRSSPFRTAAGSNAAPTTVSQTQCPGGRCNINRGMDFPGTVVMSEPIIQSVSPITTSVVPSASRIAGESEAQYRARIGDQYGTASIGAIQSPVTQGAMMRYEAAANRIMSEKERDRELRLFVEKGNLELAKEAARQDAIKAAADAALTDQTTQMTKEATGRGYADTARDLLEATIREGQSPETYADARIKMDLNTMTSTGKPADGQNAPVTITSQPLAGTDLTKRYLQYRREGYGGLAIHFVLTSEQVFNKASSPLEDADVEETNFMLGRSVDALVSGYSSSEVLGKDWNTVQGMLMNDVQAPLVTYMRKRFEEENADALSVLPKKEQARQRAAIMGSADEYASKWYNLIESEIAMANRAAGGGWPDNPNGDSGWVRRSRTPDQWNSRTESMPDVPAQRQPAAAGMRME